MGNSISLHEKRKLRNRKALKRKSYGKLRLTVFRSSRHIYGQIIDDINGITVTSASSLENNIKKQFKNCGTKEVATLVGKLIAEKALKDSAFATNPRTASLEEMVNLINVSMNKGR